MEFCRTCPGETNHWPSAQRSRNEFDPLRMSCDARSRRINCDMVQMSVRKQSKPSELKEKLDKAIAQWETEKPMAQKNATT